jgi:hypothetical protein
MMGTLYAYRPRKVIMRFQTIRAAHRVVVDWVAEKFHLTGDHARDHAEARARAQAAANAWNRREMPSHTPRRAPRRGGEAER